MADLRQAALDYAKSGLPIFPCNSSKEPLTPGGVLDATTDPAKVASWWDRWPRANIGMDVGGAGMAVVDYDPGSSPLPSELAPETLMRQSTPRGGRHLFYALKPGEVVSPSASKLAPHVDVRSFHSYVLLAPSRTADGAYEWESQGRPAYRTDEFVRQANSHREKSKGRDEWIIPADLDENVAAAVKWLRDDAKVAVEGQGGDACAYATAAMMKSFGISEPRAFELMWDYWNPRCVPPWNGDEAEHLETKIRNGFAFNTSPPGNMTTAYRVAKASQLFKPVVVPLPTGRERQNGRFRFVDREGMAHIKPATWLLKDFLPAGGYAMLIGAPGTFKTFVALDVALTIATALPVAGIWEAVQPGAVLYAAGEGRASMASRVAAWEREHFNGMAVENFVLADPVPNVGSDDDWTAFVAGAKELSEAYKLVVIDTVGRAMQGLNENSQEHASKLTQRVEQLQHELGCAVLCLHHTGHTAQERARGSTVFLGDPDTVVRLDRDGKDFTLSLTMLKQKDAEEWPEPKRLAMKELTLAPEVKSLVAVADRPASPHPAAETKEGKPAPSVSRKGRNQHSGEAEALIVRKQLAGHVVAVLGNNTLQRLSDRTLADKLAMIPNIGLDFETLRKQVAELRRHEDYKGDNAPWLYDTGWRHKA